MSPASVSRALLACALAGALSACIPPLAGKQPFFRDARLASERVEASVVTTLRRAEALRETALACTAPARDPSVASACASRPPAPASVYGAHAGAYERWARGQPRPLPAASQTGAGPAGE